MRIFEKYKAGLRDLDVSPLKYLFMYILPLLLIAILFVYAIVIFMPFVLKNALLRIFILLLPIVLIIIAITYPLIYRMTRAKEINDNMNLFITRMGVLATTNLSRKELIRIIAKSTEYGALSEEINKVHTLVEYWNYSLPEAARTVARLTPSVLLADFLDRMAHSLDSGEDFVTFLEKEQNVVMNEYAAKYSISVRNLDIIRDVFISTVISAVFFIVFTYFLPIFMQINIEILVGGAVVGFLGMEVLMYFLVKFMLPKDEYWHPLARKPPIYRILRISFIPTIFLCIFLFYITLQLRIPEIVVVAITLTPLIIPGVIIKIAESNLERCDENYDSFIRAIGSSLEAAGGTLEMSISKIQRHDFGPLTNHIQILYRRLVTKIDKVKAWEFFAADTGSNLITKFTDMYAEGIRLGGRPEIAGRFITSNFVKMIILRKERKQASSSFNGILYGIGVAIVFSLSLGVGVIEQLNNLFSAVTTPGLPIALPLLTAQFNVRYLTLCAVAIIVVHCTLSAFITKVVSGRHRLTPLIHIVGMVWSAAIVYLIAKYVMDVLFSI